MKKLTRAQQAAWEAIKYLVEQDKDTWRGYSRGTDGKIFAGYGTGITERSLRAIERAGLIALEPDFYGGMKKFRLTDAGKAQLAPDAAPVPAPAEDAPIELDYAKLWRDEVFQREWAEETNERLEKQLAEARAALMEIRGLDLRNDAWGAVRRIREIVNYPPLKMVEDDRAAAE